MRDACVRLPSEALQQEPDDRSFVNANQCSNGVHPPEVQRQAPRSDARCLPSGQTVPEGAGHLHQGERLCGEGVRIIRTIWLQTNALYQRNWVMYGINWNG